MSTLYTRWQPHQPLSIESTVDEFVTTTGGILLSSTLEDGRTPCPNADYVFDREGIVVELKSINTDWPQLYDYKEKLASLWIRHEILGRLSSMHGSGIIPIPSDIRREFLLLLRKPLKRILEKANRQIRSTRRNFGRENHKGVLLLVADGLLTMSPQYLMQILAQILAHNFSEIKCVVLITINEYVDFPGDDIARLIWAPMYQDETDEILGGFIDSLGKAWGEFLETKIEGLLPGVQNTNSDALAGTKFVSAPRAIHRIIPG